MTPDRLRLIEKTFHDARAHSGAEREAVIAAACGGDSALRREVESLLDQEAGGVLDAPIGDTAAALLPPARLSAGASVGPYHVEALVGSGGMGEVYRARDMRLGRTVALKLLSPSFAADADRVARFDREARLLAALNHPHIAQIHGLEQAGNTHVLVLEFADGLMLDRRIGGRPLPPDEALGIADQIAAALEAAHERGIVHRDLKPANIAVTPDGQVKVLDFGLAKALEPSDGSSAAAHASAASGSLTDVGVVVGTAAYMAPEQAAGRRVDKRADVWAFGCVLYEMLTGARAFPGGDVQQTLASVLAHAPDWDKLPAATPPQIRRLMRRCLEKDLSQRLRDIADARLEIADARAGREDVAGVAPKRANTLVAAIAAGAVAASVALALARWYGGAAAAPSSVQRLSVTFAPSAGMHPMTRHFALSPDGARLAYVGLNGRLWLRSLDAPDARQLPGTDQAYDPFFSPDGEWVGYIQGDAWGGGDVAKPGTLKKVAVRGGVPITLADAALLGASWGRDGTIVFCRRTSNGVALFTVSASGGPATQVTTPPGGNAAFRVAWPGRLPDETTILFSETDGATFESGRTIALSLRTGERRVLLEQGYGARYVASGHLVYALNGALMAVPFDARRLTVTGPPAQILSSVDTWRQVGWVGVSTSNNLLLYGAAVDGNTSQTLAWVSRDAEPVSVVSDRAQFSFPRLSPDGHRLAVGAGDDIWVLDLARGTRTLVAARDRGNYPAPTITAWTSDSRRLVMNRRNTTDTSLVLVDPDDPQQATVLVQSRHFVQVGSWSRNGALAFFQIPGTSARDVWVLDPGAREPRPFASTAFNERGAVFSPDGRWIAYAADASGRDEIYLRPYPGPGRPIAVSVGGGAEPVWSRSGREIFYRDGTRMLSVSFTAAPSLQLGSPRVMFDQPFATSNLGVANFDVAPDGRFIMIASSDPKARPVELGAIVNWSEVLKARASAR